MMIPIEHLTHHPFSVTIYGDEELNEDFVENISDKGILNPITINSDNRIISGHRRWNAAKIVGLAEVPVVIANCENELVEREAILDFNRQREKTIHQKMREAEELEAIEKEKAKIRQTAFLQQGSNFPVEDNLFTTEKGQSRDKVAKRIG